MPKKKKIEPKKVEPKVEKTFEEKVGEKTFEKELIAPLGLDFGREDLNILVGKVNEIIKKVNQ